MARGLVQIQARWERDCLCSVYYMLLDRSNALAIATITLPNLFPSNVLSTSQELLKMR